MLRTITTAALALLITTPCLADLQALDNPALSEVAGQAGINIRLDLQARINAIRFSDTTGNVSLRNVKIDNGCVNPGVTFRRRQHEISKVDRTVFSDVGVASENGK